MKIVSKEEMKALEIENSNKYGIDEWLMMEHAAVSLFLAIEDEVKDLHNKNVLIIAGKGNNGGDAMASARNFIEAGSNVEVLLAFGEPSGKLPQKHLNILKKIGLRIEKYDPSKKELAKAMVESADIVLDGILGTGASNLVPDDLKELMKIVNENSRYTVSVDLPSGIESNTGKVLGQSIAADMTVTFGMLKSGMLFYPARQMCGKIKIGKIGFPPRLIEDMKLKGELITFNDVKKIMPTRPRLSHKGTFGRVAIIAGSRKYTGAPILVVSGALRVGAGLVTVGMPEPFNTIVTSVMPEAISYPLPATQDGFITVKARPKIEELTNKANVLAIGPGIGTNFETGEVVKWLISNFDKPIILDADALNLLARDVDSVEFSENMAITPHPAEFSRLISKDVNTILSNPTKYALEFAVKRHVNVLLKGATTVIATPDGRYFLNVTGNTGLATGGSGDVLTGMIAGFVAQGVKVEDALKLAAYVHGRCAEVYSQENDEASLIPQDLIDNIPKVLKELNSQ
ncbi:NAD(P)H-hydrate dehydratase [Mesoaciditoga sp.]